MVQTSRAPSEAPSRRRLLAAAAAVAVGTAVLLVLTSAGVPKVCEPLPMVWDEGSAIRRAEGIARWTARWLPAEDENPQPGPFNRQAIEADWQYTTQIEGHPAFYGIVIAAGRALCGGWPRPLDGARFGPMVLFSLAAGAMFYRLTRDYSVVAGMGGVAALVLLPRIFAHAHFASCDGTLTACWVLAWAAFAPARRGRAQAVLFGVLLGMTMATKATGWLAPLPFLAAAALGRDRSAGRALALGLPVAAATFLVLNPPLWHDPLGGLRTFFALNLNRAANPNLNISTWFLGRMYNLDHPLPWYNTLFWTAVTVPVGTLLLAGVGLAAIVRRRREDQAGMVLVANWLVLLVVRALPGAPPHDGVRLFLPAFAFLAALAGVGCARILDKPPAETSSEAGVKTPAARATRRRWLAAGVVLLYAGSAGSLLWYAPQWLSYYNLLIGGLPGATALGMEPTYYWDSLDRGVLRWLDEHTAEDEKVQIGPPGWEPLDNLRLMHDWGQFHFRFLAGDRGRYRWYVLQHRPSGWRDADRRLVEQGRPSLEETIRPRGVGPWRLDVPLLAVYPYQQYLEARDLEARAAAPRPTYLRVNRSGRRSFGPAMIGLPAAAAAGVD